MYYQKFHYHDDIITLTNTSTTAILQTTADKAIILLMIRKINDDYELVPVVDSSLMMIYMHVIYDI